MNRRRLGIIFIIAAFVVLLPVIPAAALTFGSGTYGMCQYDSCSITISSNGSLALNVIPTATGACTTQSDSVSVLTDDPSGYNLTLANSSTNTSLLNGSSTIGASSASQASPAALSANTWGYRVDGLGGFGSGPTTAQSNTSLNATTYAGVPASSGTASTLANTNVAADPAINTKVWYSACSNTSTASGTYTSSVTYTAITN